MQTQRINITIPNLILKMLQENIPSGKRSKFIAEAVLENLTVTKNINQLFKKSLRENTNFYNQIDNDWKNTEFETWPR